MTRCHCTDVPFEEVARRMRAGQGFDQATLEAGAGLLCTACLPDLRAHVAGIEAGAKAALAPADPEPTAA
ncbi:MAG TPA: hypothetical protein VEQ10_11400 [Vicinamibacteria bacterium]|nr:hypothetical protein [Vicinamibacteria bacterium]